MGRERWDDVKAELAHSADGHGHGRGGRAGEDRRCGAGAARRDRGEEDKIAKRAEEKKRLKREELEDAAWARKREEAITRSGEEARAEAEFNALDPLVKDEFTAAVPRIKFEFKEGYAAELGGEIPDEEPNLSFAEAERIAKARYIDKAEEDALRREEARWDALTLEFRAKRKEENAERVAREEEKEEKAGRRAARAELRDAAAKKRAAAVMRKEQNPDDSQLPQGAAAQPRLLPREGALLG